VTAARERGQNYLLERHLLRRLSNGAVIEQAWTQFSFPTGYHYDVLRGLEYLRDAGATPDARMAEAIELVASKRDAAGRWPLENVHPDQLDAEPGTGGASQAAGTRCAPYGCWTGIPQEPEAVGDGECREPQPAGRPRPRRPG
jgi:hypothetical protein